MITIPFSILLSSKSNILPLPTIQEHQKFCQKFLKAHQSFGKYKNNSKSKLAFVNENVFLIHQKEQNQQDVLNWFDSLTIEQKMKICSIKNKWFANIITQLFNIYYKVGNCVYKPISEMALLFAEQRKYLQKEEINYLSQKLNDIFSSSNYKFNIANNLDKNSNKNESSEEEKYIFDEMNIYDNFFLMQEVLDDNYIKSDKREIEKKFIEKIRIFCTDNDLYDTITFSKEFLTNIDQMKYFLSNFSGDNYFRDWLLPIKANNVYNFVLPLWMHNYQGLNICQIIMGFFEQKILLNYEYYYYTKKIYEFSNDAQIWEIYKENEKLEKYINNTLKNNEQIFNLEEIKNIVDNLRANENFHKKIKLSKEIFERIFSNKLYYSGKEININDEFAEEIYNYLNNESHSISNTIDLITFIKFYDIINYRDDVFLNLRKKLVDLQCNQVLDELQSDGFLCNKKTNKKHKKKKKKLNAADNVIKKEDQKIETPKSVIKDKKPKFDFKLLKECECEYNMTSTINMIQENDINIYINPDGKNNNNICILETKKENSQSKNKEKIKVEENKIKEKKEKNKEEGNKLKEEEKIIEDEKINEESKKNEKQSKNKEFFLYPIAQKKKKNNNNSINEINTKKESNKCKKHLEEDQKEINNNSINFVQERKNIVQINPSKRKKFKYQQPFETSSINFEMCRKTPPIDNSYPYYFSFPRIKKPFTSLKEGSTMFSLAATKKDNFKTKNKNNKKNNNKSTNKNNNCNLNNKDWNYPKYNCDNNNNYFLYHFFNNYVPSEKFFESMNKEINNYCSITNINKTNLSPIFEKYLEKIENIIQNGLQNNYEIKFGHYGSYFTDLSIEGSDLDILIYYKSKNEFQDFYKDIIELLTIHKNEFDFINPILTASVPIIKLQIDISEEIKDLKMKNMFYFESNEISKINIDLSISQDEKDYQRSHDIVSYINQSVEEYPQIKSIILILKRFFKQMKMNKSFTGGLSSFSLYLLALCFCKYNIQCESVAKLLYFFMENFSYFDYANFGINVEDENYFYSLDQNNNNNENDADNFSETDTTSTDFELMNKKDEIYIIDPLTKLNVAKSSFKVDEIRYTFNTGFDLLRMEGWRYDCANFTNKNNDGAIYDSMDELYEDESSDFAIIKKLFGIKSNRNYCDFFSN